MSFDLGRFTRGAASGASTVGGVTGFNPYATVAGGIIGGLSSIFEKSDEEIANERKAAQIAALLRMKESSLQRLSDETGKNIGRVNQFTTGSIQRANADTGRRAAGSGRSADEADFLASQGQITSQGSNAIQHVTDASESERRRLEDYYAQQELGINSDIANAPIQPNFTDVLESIAPAALSYGMNNRYLDTFGKNSVDVNSQIPVNHVQPLSYKPLSLDGNNNSTTGTVYSAQQSVDYPYPDSSVMKNLYQPYARNGRFAVRY